MADSKDSRKSHGLDLPMELGRDLQSADKNAGSLNQSDKDLTHAHAHSGSSNREGGYDLHPHKGDHGEAQKKGSAKESDYYGKEIGYPGPTTKEDQDG